MNYIFEILPFYAQYNELDEKIESDHKRDVLLWHESKYYPRKKKKLVRKKIMSNEIIYRIYKSIWQ